jgi:hypothetical protein
VLSLSRAGLAWQPREHSLCKQRSNSLPVW